jgi:hypothetical protein
MTLAGSLYSLFISTCPTPSIELDMNRMKVLSYNEYNNNTFSYIQQDKQTIAKSIPLSYLSHLVTFGEPSITSKYEHPVIREEIRFYTHRDFDFMHLTNIDYITSFVIFFQWVLLILMSRRLNNQRQSQRDILGAEFKYEVLNKKLQMLTFKYESKNEALHGLIDKLIEENSIQKKENNATVIELNDAKETIRSQTKKIRNLKTSNIMHLMVNFSLATRSHECYDDYDNADYDNDDYNIDSEKENDVILSYTPLQQA